MKQTNIKKDNFTEKLTKGLTLSFERLLQAKQRNNAKLAFSENGKVVKVNARDITTSK